MPPHRPDTKFLKAKSNLQKGENLAFFVRKPLGPLP